MLEYIQILYIALPVFIANMAPVIAAKKKLFKGLDKPIDGSSKIAGKQIFGPHKTWRGFAAGIGAATIAGFLQYLLHLLKIVEIQPFAYLGSALTFGFLAGTGALVGDAFFSFAKRQLGIKSGKPFIPFDQIDYILGFLLFTFPTHPWSAKQIIFLLAFAIMANPLTNLTAYFLGIKKTYW